MSSKYIIITGANSGIGKEAALLFAKAGYNVIMACRNIEKSKIIQEEITALSDNPNIYLLQADMSSLSSIMQFANEYKLRFPKLDILIHNAAYFSHGEKYRLSADGIEMCFATNVLGPLFMTTQLIDSLKASEAPQILNISSNIINHYFSPKKSLDLENLKGYKSSNFKYSVYKYYANSKLAFLMLSFKMAEEFKELGIKVNSLQVDGAKMSKNTLNKFTFGWRIIAMIQNLYFPKPDFWGKKYFELCTDDKFKDATGKYFNKKLEQLDLASPNATLNQIVSSKYYPYIANDSKLQDKVWDFSNHIITDFLHKKQ